jgi:hypothetical protein
MVLTNEQVEKAITKVINEVKRKLKITASVDRDVCPGNINGLTSQILVTLIGRIGNDLGVSVPNGCYIFKDRDSDEQLSVKQAAQKLIKAVKNGK